MKILLIVGAANDIFIYNYAKWMKKSMDCQIDVFEFYPSTQQGYNNEYYDYLGSASHCGIPIVRKYIDPYIKANNLVTYLKGKHYDIIHCHWIVSPLVLVKNLKRYCTKLIMTFWGREYANMYLLESNKRFRKHLDAFSKDVDAMINSKTSESLLKSQIPHFKGNYYSASLGSAPVEALYNLMQTECRKDSKIALGIPTDKICVLIGYSGKQLHQHVSIIEELSKHNGLKEKLHLLAPMTRGANSSYVETVQKMLKRAGYTYTLISGRFLSDIEMAQVRNSTDITLQFATTDGFSRSIIECLCAKSLMIYGDWLGYERHLKPNGFNGICVKSIKEGIEKIPEILNNFSQFEEMLQKNHESGKAKYLWSVCIKDWINAYNDLLK